MRGRAVATTTDEFGDFYNERLAASDLRRYREKGPRPWTRTLIESLKAEGVEGATLLDIGGGVGVIHHELLAAGAASATCVDASAAYLATAKAESERRGYDERVTYRHGDFVELAESIPPADIVTLDRVINVYPDWQRLVELSAARTRRLYGLVYPRDRRFMRLVIFAMNLVLRMRRKGVRASVHPADAIERVLRENGLSLHVSKSVGPAWQVAVYRRL
jgi:2-polyprenyl-3-methyl-5-hydroxy-6-metoxy-1,4-benzoquinol methylase